MAAGGSLFQNLLRDNERWADDVHSKDSSFFEKSAEGQSPHTLWIGCSDSRIPETKLCNAQPGDIFVHRNIANVVKPDDGSINAVVEFAVAAMKVKQIILCGHTSCGGVAGALAAVGDQGPGGKVEAWLEPIKDLIKKNKDELDKETSEDERKTGISRLNVKEGVRILKEHAAVKAAMQERGLEVYGVLYNLGTGKLKQLDV